MAKRSAKVTSAAALKSTAAQPGPEAPTAGTETQLSPAQQAVREAGRITGELVGNIQNAQKAFLRIGQLLTDVRDRKLYEPLHDADMEAYAAHRLNLSPTSLYRYMKTYAWVRERHPEWLEPGTKVRIPDLSEIGGLIWIENELQKKDLDPSRKAALEALRQKALEGHLTRKELREFKRRNTAPDKAKRAYLAKMRNLRREGTKREIDAKVLGFLDQAISTLEHELMLDVAGMGVLDDWKPAGRPKFFDRNSLLT